MPQGTLLQGTADVINNDNCDVVVGDGSKQRPFRRLGQGLTAGVNLALLDGSMSEKEKASFSRRIQEGLIVIKATSKAALKLTPTEKGAQGAQENADLKKRTKIRKEKRQAQVRMDPAGLADQVDALQAIGNTVDEALVVISAETGLPVDELRALYAKGGGGTAGE